ncbi:hypothetical protein C5745_16540 [Sphingobacterium haloxyli]|uniref:Uncharacterized protein n=1 Tax=Sphingobacterium haloxyli TaxID=2100533 RepID=A0A2S9J0A5_9SPHI|nr:hypothetical protein C5745_16540 [Sphingobacterium haloxyli]
MIGCGGQRDAGTAIKCKKAQWAGGAKAAPLNSRQMDEGKKMDAMNSKGTAKTRTTDFLHSIGELQLYIQIRLYALFLRISMAVPLVSAILFLQLPPCRIVLAQQRVVKRFYYPRKFAPFTGS